MPDHAAQLGKCPLFAGLEPEEMNQVAEGSRVVNVRAGDLVFREGQVCEGFYVVVAGSVRLYKIGPDGRERILHVVRPPQSFAEAAMFGPVVYPAFASAVEDCRLILVRREPFLRMLGQQPDFASRLFESLSKWLHRLLDELENETFLNARAKLANYLLREARRGFGGTGACRIELRLPKKEVASQLGMAPETLSRALADLEGRGLIRSAGRRIDIPDVASLEDGLLDAGDAG
jgi:CRP/FNR family transcriptional regulator